ncbi:hypothetical protein MTO96_044985 [Rhipicephalus appendiculatus]
MARAFLQPPAHFEPGDNPQQAWEDWKEAYNIYEQAYWIGIKYKVIGKLLTIGGYGSGRVTPCGEASVNFTVNQATADVPVLIVPNESQVIPVIVGQPFTEQPHVTVVRRRNTVRIFGEENVDESDDTLQSIEIPDLPRVDSSSVKLRWICQALRYRQRTQRRCLRECPTQERNIKANEWVARAEVCYLGGEPMQGVKSSCSAMGPCSTATANVKTGPSVTSEHCEKLDRLIEEYRDCFAEQRRRDSPHKGSRNED